MSFNLLPNSRAIHNVTFPSATQAQMWKKRQLGYSTSQIASEFQKSLPYVSKTLRITNKKVKLILEDMARTNLIKLDKISDVYGFAMGYSPMLNRKAYISFQPTIGVHVWYEHDGKCEECPIQSQCSDLLLREAEERKIKIPKKISKETEIAEYIIKEICKQLGW